MHLKTSISAAKSRARPCIYTSTVVEKMHEQYDDDESSEEKHAYRLRFHHNSS